MLHHPHLVFSHKLLHIFFPMLRQRTLHSTFTKTQDYKSFFSNWIPSGFEQQSCRNQWYSRQSFCFWYLVSHAQVYVYPPTVLSPWIFRQLCLHDHAGSGALLQGPTIWAFITLATQSTMAHETAVPPLSADLYFSTAIQKPNSSCTSKMVQGSLSVSKAFPPSTVSELL